MVFGSGFVIKRNKLCSGVMSYEEPTGYLSNNRFLDSRNNVSVCLFNQSRNDDLAPKTTALRMNDAPQDCHLKREKAGVVHLN
jgi:hypothetical protein